MELISLSCNHCGAPLEVPEKTRYLTCKYCSARLEVRRSGGAVYTEELQKIGEQTEQMAEDLETIKLQNELERLDREWQMARQQYMVQGKDGEYQIPNTTGSTLGGAIAALFGVFWIGMAASMGAPGLFVLFGVVLVVMAIATAVRGVAKANAYERHLQAYEEGRERLLDKMGDRID